MPANYSSIELRVRAVYGRAKESKIPINAGFPSNFYDLKIAISGVVYILRIDLVKDRHYESKRPLKWFKPFFVSQCE